jgi:site-specific recombinase XerD
MSPVLNLERSSKYLRNVRAIAIFARDLRRRNYAETTINFDTRAIKRFFAFTRAQVRKITKNDIKRFLAHRARAVKANTIAQELFIIKHFFATLIDAELLIADPTAGIDLKGRNEGSAPLLLSEKSISRLFRQALTVPVLRRSPEVCRAVALRNRACFELLYGTGIRATEAARVHVVDVNFKDGDLLVRRVKRGAPRFVPLPPASLPHLERYLKEGRPYLVKANDQGIFLLSYRRGHALTGNDVLHMVSETGRRIGLKAHPHALRRALATHLVRRGASIAAVRELLGHVRLQTTQRYVAVDRKELHEAVSVLEKVLARDDEASHPVSRERQDNSPLEDAHAVPHRFLRLRTRA